MQAHSAQAVPVRPPHFDRRAMPEALAAPDTTIRLFGKPEVHGTRRMGVALALGRDVEDAKRKAIAAADAVTVLL